MISRPAPAPLLACLLAAALCACSDGDQPDLQQPSGAEPGEELSGGDTTVFDLTRDAFARPAKNLSDDHRDEFSLGDHFFNRNWITAPASASGNDGLGPVYNATSCSACHFKDGRGAPPEGPDDDWMALVMRLAAPGADEHGGPVPEPTYGLQFNQLAILGVASEGRPSLTWAEDEGTFGDGETYRLRRPVYTFAELAFGPLVAGARTSARIARPLIGLGLLEAVSEADVLASADEHDTDGDGISGRPNRVWDRRTAQLVLGRFGWKAGRPTVEEQVGGAFHEDIGVTSALFLDENCTEAQEECGAAITGGKPELDDDKLGWLTHYTETLAVPARRRWDDAVVLRGKALFHEAGCSGCHRAKLVTGTLEGFPELSEQQIRPYTDLLLHDMGDGLAADRDEYSASGREWRTPPLWGIGLVETVNRHTFFLHDGRARGFVEAILWHDGEAIIPRERFRNMPRADRDAVVQFLESL